MFIEVYRTQANNRSRDCFFTAAGLLGDDSRLEPEGHYNRLLRLVKLWLRYSNFVQAVILGHLSCQDFFIRLQRSLSVPVLNHAAQSKRQGTQTTWTEC